MKRTALFLPVLLALGAVAAGEHTLSVEIMGANERAVKAFMFGLDCVKFEPLP